MPDENETDAEGFVPPRNETERALAAIWAEVLQVPRVGVQDNFFALGGHSFVALRIQSRVRHAFGVQIPINAIFEAPTVAELSLRITRAQSNPEEAGASPESLVDFESLLDDDEPDPPHA